MYPIWFLFALVLVAPMYAAWRIQRLGKRELYDCDSRVSQHRAPLEIIPEIKAQPAGADRGMPGREVHWMSTGQFTTFVQEHKDVIVVDLRADEQRMLSPIPAAFVLTVVPDELDNLLGWLPAEKSVAFCGVSKQSILLIVTSPCMEGSAPLYVLDGDLRLAEVA